MKYSKSLFVLSFILMLSSCGGGGSGEVSNKHPVANAGNDIEINMGGNAQFDASSSHDADGSITKYEWKEGTTVLSNAKSFEKNDFSIGTHNIRLSVIDNEGATATDDLVLIVRETKLVFLKDDKHGREPWMTNGTAFGTYLVKDINQQQQSSHPDDLVWVGDTLFFSASDDAHGRELWMIDRTTEETRLVKDIVSGTKGSDPQDLIKVGNSLFFFANNGGLWKTDGTEAGTVLLKDFKTHYFSSLKEINGIVYFSARDGIYGAELWRSDGTASGTKMVKDINKGSGSSIEIGNIDMFSFVMNEHLYFQARIGNGYQLWKSDGTEAGTIMLKNIRLQRNSSIEPIIIDNFHYFVATDEVHGFEMWKTDGTEAGTQMVKDINIGERGSLEHKITKYPVFSVVNNVIIFQAYDRDNGYKIWKTDGTEAGTQILKDLFSGYGSRPAYGGTVTHKNEVYFNFNNNTIPAGGSRNLWKTDGTEAGTKLVKSDVNSDSGLYSAGDYVYFINHDKLWRTDGTESGTLVVKNELLVRYYDHSIRSSRIEIADHNGIIYFTASDGEHGYELWKSDGTDDGTVMVKDINTSTHDSVEEHTRVYKKGLHYYFAAKTESGHTGLWKTDGSEIGTTLVKDFNLGSSRYDGTYRPNQLVQAGNSFYFTAFDKVSGREIWKSDGTVLGTMLLKDINEGVNGSYPDNLISKEGKTYFTVGNYGSQSLWTTDGTEEGTVSILAGTSIYSRRSDADTPATQSDMVIINGIFYFSQNISNLGGRGKAGLWKSDGTSEGTVLIKTMSIDGNIINMVELNNSLYFTISDQLWKSDGSKAGTIKVKDLDNKEDVFVGMIDPLIVLSNKLYFGAGDKLWVSDGSSSGTKMIIDTYMSNSQTIFTGLVTNGNLLYFSGNGLWRSDGTESGTLKLKDSFKYIHSSFENGALFTADDGEGTALWRTNGTEADTEIIKALY